MIPEELRYTEEHEWVSAGAREGTLRVGVTEYAQDQLGDVVFVDLPETGTTVTAGEPFGEIEYEQTSADCVTVRVWPAIVSVPVRAPPIFGSTR